MIQGWDKVLKFLKPEQTAKRTEFACISLAPEGVRLVCGDYREDKVFELRYCDFIPVSSTGSLVLALSGLVKKYSLIGVHCSILLQPTDYQLLLMDELPVPADELRQALPWRVKEMLKIPVSDLVTDYFTMPIKVGGGEAKTINVIAANKSQLQNLVELVFASALEVRVIDIFELALSNIAQLYSEEQLSTALLYLQGSYAQLVIIREETLYFSRRLQISIETEPDTESGKGLSGELLEKIVLELQRSFDYYQSQLRQVMPDKLLVTCADLPEDELVNALSQQLSCKVAKVELTKVVNFHPGLAEIPKLNEFLPVIGGVLHKETIPDATS